MKLIGGNEISKTKKEQKQEKQEEKDDIKDQQINDWMSMWMWKSLFEHQQHETLNFKL